MSDQRRSLRRVVFHADDFGMNAAVNAGILTAFVEGLLTSTSLLANAPAAEQACRAWPELIEQQAAGTLASMEARRRAGDLNHSFDLGIHLNLTQGRPLTGDSFPPELLDEQGNFPGIGKLFLRLRGATPDQLSRMNAELTAQIEWMIDHGHRPTHLNGHQYIEMIPQVSAMIPGLLTRFQIPSVRVAREGHLFRNVLLQGDIKGWCLALVKRYYAGLFRNRMEQLSVSHADQFFGTSHAGRIDFALVSRFLSQSGSSQLTEIGVHPAVAPLSDAAGLNDAWFDPLADLRPRELEWLCSPQLVEELVRRNIGPGRLGADQSVSMLEEVTGQNSRIPGSRKLAS